MYLTYRVLLEIKYSVLEIFEVCCMAFFSPTFPIFFFKESNWENLGSKLGKNKILFCIGNGADTKSGRSRALVAINIPLHIVRGILGRGRTSVCGDDGHPTNWASPL